MKLDARVILPKPGETRTKSAFAWLPTVAGDSVIWFERYEILEAYLVSKVVVEIAGKQKEVVYGEWKRVSTRLKS